jgi:hypothetical protein
LNARSRFANISLIAALRVASGAFLAFLRSVVAYLVACLGWEFGVL